MPTVNLGLPKRWELQVDQRTLKLHASRSGPDLPHDITVKAYDFQVESETSGGRTTTTITIVKYDTIQAAIVAKLRERGNDERAISRLEDDRILLFIQNNVTPKGRGAGYAKRLTDSFEEAMGPDADTRDGTHEGTLVWNRGGAVGRDYGGYEGWFRDYDGVRF